MLFRDHLLVKTGPLQGMTFFLDFNQPNPIVFGYRYIS
jgi:hypothetical protein